VTVVVIVQVVFEGQYSPEAVEVSSSDHGQIRMIDIDAGIDHRNVDIYWSCRAAVVGLDPVHPSGQRLADCMNDDIGFDKEHSRLSLNGLFGQARRQLNRESSHGICVYVSQFAAGALHDPAADLSRISALGDLDNISIWRPLRTLWLGLNDFERRNSAQHDDSTEYSTSHRELLSYKRSGRVIRPFQNLPYLCRISIVRFSVVTAAKSRQYGNFFGDGQKTSYPAGEDQPNSPIMNLNSTLSHWIETLISASRRATTAWH
jgi:hypothetical protein